MSTPLHPLIVHFPIVMLLLGAVAQVVALWKRDFFDKAATYLIAGGFITGVVSYLSGEGAEEYAEANLSATESMIEPHETLALLSLVVFGLAVAIKVLRYYRPSLKLLTPLLVVVVLIGSGLISATGHYGGKIVYQEKGSMSGQMDTKKQDRDDD